MTKSNIPTANEFEQIEPERNSIIKRESDEGLSIEAYIVCGDSIRETSAQTYTRSFGHYFLEADSDCANLLDEIMAEYKTEKGILSSFDRNRFDGYEIMIEVNDILSESSEFEEINRAKINLTSKSNQMDKVDELLNKIESKVE